MMETASTELQDRINETMSIEDGTKSAISRFIRRARAMRFYFAQRWGRFDEKMTLSANGGDATNSKTINQQNGTLLSTKAGQMNEFYDEVLHLMKLLVEVGELDGGGEIDRSQYEGNANTNTVEDAGNDVALDLSTTPSVSRWPSMKPVAEVDGTKICLKRKRDGDGADVDGSTPRKVREIDDTNRVNEERTILDDGIGVGSTGCKFDEPDCSMIQEPCVASTSGGREKYDETERSNEHVDVGHGNPSRQETLVEGGAQQRPSQFIQRMREKCLTSDGILIDIKKLIEDLCVDDDTKKTPQQKAKFLSQTQDRLEKFREFLTEEYKELIERMNDLNRMVRSFDGYNDDVISSVTYFQRSRSAGESKTLDSLFEKLELLLDGYTNEKNTILGKYTSTGAVQTIDPTALANQSRIPSRNASNLNGEKSQEQNENIRGSEAPPVTSGNVLPSPDDIRVSFKVDTEQNTPLKVHKTIRKTSIRGGRNIDEPEVIIISDDDDDDDRENIGEIPNAGNIGSPNEEDVAGYTSDESDCCLILPPEPEVVIVDDDGDDDSGGTVNNNDGINDDFQNPSDQVEPFDDVIYASVEGCPNIDKEDHDALHNPKRQYTGNIMNRFMFLALPKLKHIENLREQHCDVLLTDEAFDAGRVEPLKLYERCFIQILYQRKFDHWILCYGERNGARFDIRIYDSKNRSYKLTKNNRKFLERLCGTRDLNIFKSKPVDIQARGSNDSGPYVLTFAATFVIRKNPELCSILDDRSVVRKLIKKTMIEMRFIPTWIICAPPLYPRDESDFDEYEHFVSGWCDIISEKDRFRVTISEETFSNDRVTTEYLYPTQNAPYASILYHHPTGTYFLISNIESGANAKQAHVYEVDPGKITAGLMKMMEPSSSDSPRPIVASLIPYSRVSDIDIEGTESHPQRWDDSRTALQKKIESLMLCSIKVLELTGYIRREEFDLMFLERKFKDCINKMCNRLRL